MNEIKIVTQLDRGLAYAEACFETFCVLKGQVFQQVEHQKRLQRGLKNYALACTDTELEKWFEQAKIAAHKQFDDSMVRMTVSTGEADWGLLARQQSCHVCIQIMPTPKRRVLHLEPVVWPFPLREKDAKYTADYAESLRAIQQWRLDKPMRALLCSDTGNVLSTLTANIALYRQGQWFTPQGLGILHGTVRQFLLQQGVLLEADCPSAWLDDCEAMVCMNSGVFVQAVASFADRKLDVNHAAIKPLYAVLNAKLGVPSLGVVDCE